MNKGFGFGFLIGAGAITAWYLYNKSKEKTAPAGTLTTDTAVVEVNSAVGKATKMVESTFTAATLKDFNIIMPPVQANAAVKAQAAELTDGRYAVLPENILPPVNL